MIDTVQDIKDAFRRLLVSMKTTWDNERPLVVMSKHGTKDKLLMATFMKSLPMLLDELTKDFFIAINSCEEDGLYIIEFLAGGSKTSDLTHEQVFRNAFGSVLGFDDEVGDPSNMD
jgi:hypothetical protein